VLVTLKKELFRDCSFVEYLAIESVTELRIEVRSGEGTAPSGGGWSGPHAGVTLTKSTWPKRIGVLITYRKLIFKTLVGKKLDGKEGCYSRKLLMAGICMKTKGRRKQLETTTSSVEKTRRKSHHKGGVERRHGIELKPRGQSSAIAPPSAPTHTDMDVREPFSRLKKGIKHRLTGKKPKSDTPEANAGEERADTSGLLPRPESHVVTGSGHPDVEGVVESGPHRDGNDAGEEKVEPVDPSPSTPPLAHDRKSNGM
jgi:hypothetical protein